MLTVGHVTGCGSWKLRRTRSWSWWLRSRPGRSTWSGSACCSSAHEQPGLRSSQRPGRLLSPGQWA